MDKIIYTGSLELIQDAVEDANFILSREEFLEQISDKKSFEHSNASGKVIASLIKNTTIVANIELYKPIPIPPWSRANAYTKKESPRTIFLNKRKLRNRSIESIASTLVHEYIHVIDHESEEHKFGHGDNNSEGKSSTAPYWIDQRAYEFLTGKDSKMVYQHDELK